jgi:hypothetical protein
MPERGDITVPSISSIPGSNPIQFNPPPHALSFDTDREEREMYVVYIHTTGRDEQASNIKSAESEIVGCGTPKFLAY